jgi:hypothetical protein
LEKKKKKTDDLDLSLLFLTKINLRELEACAWSSKDKEQNAPNVLKFTLHHRQIAVWVASEIIVAFNQKQRKANIEKFIQICEALRRLNNFNGMMEILGGLSVCVFPIQKKKEKEKEKKTF